MNQIFGKSGSLGSEDASANKHSWLEWTYFEAGGSVVQPRAHLGAQHLSLLFTLTALTTIAAL